MAEYCTVEEITTLGINPGALTNLGPDPVATKRKKIQVVSDMMDGYLRSQFVLPLVTWGLDVRECCATLVGVALLRTRGYDPEEDPAPGESERMKMGWLKDISRRFVTPVVVDSSPTASASGGATGQPVRIASAPSVGFSKLTPTQGPCGSCDGGGSFGG